MSQHGLSCAAVQPHLEAFADGELRGDVLRRVSQHLESCDDCSAVIESVQGVGDVLRGRPLQEADFADLAGLADGVVSRVRAEDRESWRAKFERATDDLHWVLVGGGSIAAAFLTAMSVSIVMHSSVEQRADSLASILNTVTDAPPQLGLATIVPVSIAPDSIVGANGEDDVEFANLTEVNRAGHVMSLQALPRGDEINATDAQSLVNQLRDLRFARQTERSNFTDPDARQLIWLYTATEVRGTDAGSDTAARRLIWLYTTPGKKAL
jgi:hypothetical protein